MYKISNFLNANAISSNEFVKINNEVYKIKKINKTQEDMIYNNFDEITDDMSLFLPTMYSVLFYDGLDSIKEKLINTFGDELDLKEAELKLANVIFRYIADRGCMLVGSKERNISEGIDDVKSFLLSGNFNQLYPFIRVLQEKGYKTIDIRQMSSYDIIRVCFEEVIFSDNINLIKYLIKFIDVSIKDKIIELLELYKTYNPSKENDINEILSEFNFNKEKEKTKEPLKTSIKIIDNNGNETSVEEVNKIMSHILNN